MLEMVSAQAAVRDRQRELSDPLAQARWPGERHGRSGSG